MCLYLLKNTKIRLTMLCLIGFELYSRWVPLSVWQRASATVGVKMKKWLTSTQLELREEY